MVRTAVSCVGLLVAIGLVPIAGRERQEVEWATYQNPEASITISYPAGWQVVVARERIVARYRPVRGRL